MSPKSEEYANIEDEVIDLIRRIAYELPPNTASLEIRHLEPKSNGVLVVLKPQNPSACAVGVHAVNGREAVDLSLGDYGPTWELPVEGDNPRANKQEVLQEVREMCQAVIAGNCKHKRGLLSVTGSIEIGERRYRISDLLVFRPVPPLHGTRTYEPYVSPVRP
jgi:hypothetical protein